MRRLFLQLIVVIISSIMLSACDNSQQAQKDKDTDIIQSQSDDCLDENTNDSTRLDNIAAQGCPVN